MDIIQRSQAGDRQAFAALFEQYKNLVFRTALLMLDDRHAAEDVLQEVFLRIYRSIGSYQPERGAFTTWLHRITVNICLNQRRKRRSWILPAGLAPNQAVDTGTSPEEKAEREDELQKALGRLDDKLRAVVILRFYWDYSYAEIAGILEIPLGTVQSRLNKALYSLRAELSDQPRAAQEEEILP